MGFCEFKGNSSLKSIFLYIVLKFIYVLLKRETIPNAATIITIISSNLGTTRLTLEIVSELMSHPKII